MDEHKKIIADKDGLRLDVYLASRLSSLSRTHIQKLIKAGHVSVNNMAADSSRYKIKLNDCIDVTIPPPEDSIFEPEKIPLDIIYEDKHLIILNKSPGIVVHPASGRKSHTLVNALLYYSKHLSQIGGLQRPGIVHRLDKDTSGVMVVAKTDSVHVALSMQFQNREIVKKYYALVEGLFKQANGTIELPIGRSIRNRKKMAVGMKRSRKAVTSYKVLKQFRDCTLLEIGLHTGRTHQIRVHMAYTHHPVIGDKTYYTKSKKCKDLGINRQMLHAYMLGFIHPVTNKYLEFTAPLPYDMKRAIEILEN